MTIYLVDLESISTRYTSEWKSSVPHLLRKNGHEVVVIEGPADLPNNTTPGMFLNFAATNIYKSSQVEKFSQLFADNIIKDGDYFLFTDAWHPGIINLKYMAELLGIKIQIGACWHAGSYDPADGLGRLIGNTPWVRHAEKSFFHAIDHNYFATDFHINMFCLNLLSTTSGFAKEWIDNKKIVRTGWPMEYMPDTLAPYVNLPKRDLILFPHRIAPEKQVDIFRDLAKILPQYEFVVCQDQQLSKHEYHTLLGQAKIVFSASKQETLGIGCYEGALVGAIPLVPDRLSYTEMYLDNFKYPSEWTQDFDTYVTHRLALAKVIAEHMAYFSTRKRLIEQQAESLSQRFFSAGNLISTVRIADK